MPPRLLFRRVPFALMLTLFRLWRHLPPAQRRKLLLLVSTHGPRLAQQAMARRRRRQL